MTESTEAGSASAKKAEIPQAAGNDPESPAARPPEGTRPPDPDQSKPGLGEPAFGTAATGVSPQEAKVGAPTGDGGAVGPDRPARMVSDAPERRVETDLIPLDAYCAKAYGFTQQWQCLMRAVRDELGEQLQRVQGALVRIAAQEPRIGLAIAAVMSGADGIEVAIKKPAPGRSAELSRLELPHLDLVLEDVKRSVIKPRASIMLTAFRRRTRADDWWVDLERTAGMLVSETGIGTRLFVVTTAENMPDTIHFDVTVRLDEILKRILGGVLEQNRRTRQESWDIDQIFEMVSENRIGLDVVLNHLEAGDFAQVFDAYRDRSKPEAAVQNLFDGFVRDDLPVHTAAIFLVSHFPNLTPGIFTELTGALLEDMRPAPGPSASEPPRPHQVTDSILKECRIAFFNRTGGSVARHGAQQSAYGRSRPRVAGFKDEDGSNALPRYRPYLLDRFHLSAPLLLRTCLEALSYRLVLGHPVPDIAESLAELAEEVLSAEGAGDEGATTSILRALFFGRIAAEPLSADLLRRSGAELMQRLLNVSFRAEDLMGRLFGRLSGLNVRHSAHVLVTTLPRDGNESFLPVFDAIAVELFWTLYDQTPDLRLEDSGLFDVREGGDPWSRRRELALWALTGMRLEGPSRLTGNRLLFALADCATLVVAAEEEAFKERERDDGPRNGALTPAQTFVCRMFFRLAAAFLEQSGAASSWAEQSLTTTDMEFEGQPLDDVVAQALLSWTLFKYLVDADDLEESIVSADLIATGAFDDQWEREIAHYAAGLNAGHRVWQLSRLALDMTVGRRALGELADRATNAWANREFGDVPGYWFADGAFVKRDTGHIDLRLREVESRNWRLLLIPLLMMAVCRRAGSGGIDFDPSDGLRQRLKRMVHLSSNRTVSYAEYMAGRLKDAEKIIASWRQALVDADMPAPRKATAAYRERSGAIKSFLQLMLDLRKEAGTERV